jgi:hypothetical protein
MSDRPYADEGEVVATFNAVRAQLDRIEEQVKRTNGRVRALEIWRAFTNGAIAVLTLLVGSGVAWLVFFGVNK